MKKELFFANVDGIKVQFDTKEDREKIISNLRIKNTIVRWQLVKKDSIFERFLKWITQ
jgi:hypothetical protein